MDTKNLDKQAQAHLAFYQNSLHFAKYCIIAIAVVLVLMAVFLI